MITVWQVAQSALSRTWSEATGVKPESITMGRSKGAAWGPKISRSGRFRRAAMRFRSTIA